MGLSSSQLQPQELVSFKKLPIDMSLDKIQIPEHPENRRPTNVKWLIVLGVFIVVLLPFMIYTLCYSDPSRLTVGYDKCGNICGQQNYHWDNIDCSGKDFTNSPFLEYENNYRGGPVNMEGDLRERQCVQSCKSGYVGVFGRCFKKSSEYELDSYPGHDVTRSRYDSRSIDMGLYFSGVKWQLTISCLLSILVAMGMLFLFRYAVSFVVWAILFGCLFGLLILVGVFWYLFVTTPENTNPKENSKQVFLAFGIVFTIFAVALAIVLVWCRKKVRLVIMLLRETTKAVFDMPGLIALPVFCVISILILTLLFVLTTLFMWSAGTLQLVMGDFYSYAPNAVMIFAMVYNLLVYLWISQFFTGIQYMIIAGAVSKWYFARDKSYLGSPIMSSVGVTFKYHLGTVALGSMLITLIQVIKMIILSLVKNKYVKVFVEACLDSIESFFKFLSKNAYIISAMHGQAFLRSGKRAAKLIIQNISDIIAVNYIGDFVLGMAKFMIVVITVLISVAIFSLAPGPHEASHLPSYIIVGVVAILVACISFGVFETTIDTIFICYCEDNLLNDGMSKPYFMSRNMMEFVQESKEIYGKK